MEVCPKAVCSKLLSFFSPLKLHSVKLGTALYGVCQRRVCFLLEPSESCTIFLGGWLMSVLVVLIFKSTLFTCAVDASLLIFCWVYFLLVLQHSATSDSFFVFPFMFQLPAPRHSMLQKRFFAVWERMCRSFLWINLQYVHCTLLCRLSWVSRRGRDFRFQRSALHDTRRKIAVAFGYLGSWCFPRLVVFSFK